MTSFSVFHLPLPRRLALLIVVYPVLPLATVFFLPVTLENTAEVSFLPLDDADPASLPLDPRTTAVPLPLDRPATTAPLLSALFETVAPSYPS